MTVITMSRTEIDRMSVLQDLATSRIKMTEAATLRRPAYPRGPTVRSFGLLDRARRYPIPFFERS